MIHLAVLVPTYNQAQALRECLHSLLDQTLAPSEYEIVVIDDGSTDQTPVVLQGLTEAHAQVRCLRLPANRGRSAARNAGIVQTRAPLIVFVDSDVLVSRSFLEQHLRAHRTFGPRIVSRGPVVPVPDGEAHRRNRPPLLMGSSAFLDTANTGVEREVLFHVGLFDEGFPGYGWEDFELGLRLQHAGIRRVFCPEAVAYHVQPDPPGQPIHALLQKEEQRAKSAVYFYRKHPSAQTRWLIQATPLHRAAFWLLSGGGMLTPENITESMAKLRSAGLAGAAYLALRGVLNVHYVRVLQMEFRRHASVPA